MNAVVRRRLALLVSAAGAAVVALDGTVLLSAQPTLREELGASVAQIQWTSTAYLVAVAALLVVAGRLGDRYGHPRVLLTGVVGFGAASAGVALAPDTGWAIAMRGAQGVFGALLQPGTLALLRLWYPAERLGRAVAFRTAAIAVAAGSGPLFGGALVDRLGWRAVFWINVPVTVLIAGAALALAHTVRTEAGRADTARGDTARVDTARAGATAARVPAQSGDPGSAPLPTGKAAGRATGRATERVTGPAAGPAAGPAGDAQRLNLPGAVLLASALAVLVHALAGVPEHGWTGGPTLLELALTAALSTLLVRHERRSGRPIVPSAVARSRPVTASMALLLTVSAGMFGGLFALGFLLQTGIGLDPFTTGLRMLPLTALMVLGAPVAGASLRRHGPRRTALTGTVLVALGIAGLAVTGPGASVAGLGLAGAVLGSGFAAVMVTATGTVVGDAPPGYAGVVGGLKQTAMNIGPTVGTAVAAGTGGLAPGGARPTLLLLAAVAALGLLPAALLPGHRTAGGPTGTAAPVTASDPATAPVTAPARTGGVAPGIGPGGERSAGRPATGGSPPPEGGQ